MFWLIELDARPSFFFTFHQGIHFDLRLSLFIIGPVDDGTGVALVNRKVRGESWYDTLNDRMLCMFYLKNNSVSSYIMMDSLLINL